MRAIALLRLPNAFTSLQAKPNGDDRLLRKVVKGMLPKNKLGAKLLSNSNSQTQSLRLTGETTTAKIYFNIIFFSNTQLTQRLMTRDPRSVERKKPGQPKARRRFQFSKR